MTTDRQNKPAGQGNRFAWLPAAMPRVAALMTEKRAAYGNAHVAECWKRGVIGLEPGWFFAREGALTIGTPWSDPVMANFAALSVTSTQALVIIKEPETAHGQE